MFEKLFDQIKNFFVKKSPNILNSFQIKNLVQSRVMFFVFSIDSEFENKFKTYEVVHLKNMIFSFSEKNSLKDLQNKIKELEMDPTVPLVLICKNGNKSKIFATKLFNRGYKNTYYVEGGSLSILN